MTDQDDKRKINPMAKFLADVTFVLLIITVLMFALKGLSLLFRYLFL